MRKIQLFWLITPVVTLVTGCSILFGDEAPFRSRSMDYQKAEERAPLQIPEGTYSVSRIELYPIPQLGVQTPDDASFKPYVPQDNEDTPQPQGLLSINQEAGVEVRESDDRRWLIVNKPLASVYASTLVFVENNGFKVEKSDRNAGLIETGWLKLREEEQPGWFKRLITLNFKDNYDKLQFRLDEINGSTRVLIDQVRESVSTMDSLPNTVDWADRYADSTLTKIVASDLSDFIAEEQVNSYRTGVLASAYANAPRTIMTLDGNGFPVLVITMDMNRAWAAVGSAFERKAIQVIDVNRSLGVYYLRREKRDAEDEDSDEESDQYQIKLLRADEGVHVTVQLNDNTLAPANEAQDLLGLIKENIE